MAVYYLDIDDEITSAAARIRGTPDVAVALVLPAGSRIATSRINFRLLAREAVEHSRRLVIVAPEASARALAASAGLPVFATVVEYEVALAETSEETVVERGEATREETGPVADRPAAAAPAAAAPTAAAAASVAAAAPTGPTTDAGVVGGRGRGEPSPRDGARRVDAEPGAARGESRADRAEAYAARTAAPGPPGRDRSEAARAIGPTTGLAPVTGPRPPRGWRRRTVLLGAAAVLTLVALIGGVAGYLVLPTATVVVTPGTVDVGPVELPVRADPDVTEPDAAAGVVPATRSEWALSAEGAFPATGKRIEETKAGGSVRWQNCDPTRAYTIPKGTVVRTAAGLGFATLDAAFLPVAPSTYQGNQLIVTCTKRSVDVTAAKAGPQGNVQAGTITVIPGAYNPTVISVTNPAATTGGMHTEFPKVTQKDVDAAVAALTEQLDAELATTAAAPPDLPAGFTAVPETAARTDPVPTVDPATLVDQEVAEFALGLGSTASVLAFDGTQVQALAAAAVGGLVPAGYDLLPGSVAVELSAASAQDGIAVVPATARARAVRRVDAAEVRATVRGRTPAEARALLEPLGAVVITTWPDWVTTITTIDARLDVRVEPLPTPGPSPTALPTAAASSAPPASPPAGTAGPAASAGPERSAVPAQSGAP